MGNMPGLSFRLDLPVARRDVGSSVDGNPAHAHVMEPEPSWPSHDPIPSSMQECPLLPFLRHDSAVFTLGSLLLQLYTNVLLKVALFRVMAIAPHEKASSCSLQRHCLSSQMRHCQHSCFNIVGPLPATLEPRSAMPITPFSK